jgi:LmbE family N-acetylglucosaminyl deacetylase
MSSKSSPVVLAAGAHPDDIEFMMAGTLLLLKEAGAEIHMWNLANGCCGTASHSREEIIRLRWQEAQDAARVAGATMHAPIFDDTEIFYDQPSIRRVAAIVREIQPDILLLQSPQDYMEDHQNSCRLLVTAAFCRGMTNFVTDPVRPTYDKPVAIYHAMPHGLRDGLRRLVRSGHYVDIASVLSCKREMLAQHRSQKEWLDVSQGMDSYLNQMEAVSARMGQLSGALSSAEGWRQHSHSGFAAEDHDPLKMLLASRCRIDEAYRESLDAV